MKVHNNASQVDDRRRGLLIPTVPPKRRRRRNAVLFALTAAMIASSCATNTERPQTTVSGSSVLLGVQQIEYVDDSYVERRDDRVLGKQINISINFNDDGPKPWRFSYWSLLSVHGVKGTNITFGIIRNSYVDVSNDDVLSIWNNLVDLGISMPSLTDGPATSVGRKWDWLFYTDSAGQRVRPKGDVERFRIDRTLQECLKIEFSHEPTRTESSCGYAVSRDSAMWRALTDVFLDYGAAKQSDPAFDDEVSLLTTQGDDQPCVDTTLEELLTQPKKYHGRRVRVSGYYHSEFEQSSLSTGPNAIDSFKESIWLGGESCFASRENIGAVNNDSTITVEGVFIAGQGGHLGAYPGAIERLTKIGSSP